jgi:hypothetical protein
MATNMFVKLFKNLPKWNLIFRCSNCQRLDVDLGEIRCLRLSPVTPDFTCAASRDKPPAADTDAQGRSLSGGIDDRVDKNADLLCYVHYFHLIEPFISR